MADSFFLVRASHTAMEIAVGLLLAPRVSRKCKISATEGFIVVHTMGNVLYNSDGFVNKNMDKLHDDIEAVIGNSTTVECWARRADMEVDSVPRGRGNKQKTVVSRFKKQLVELMDCLGQTSANYVRCIKPTPLQVAGTFDCEYVHCRSLKQLLQFKRAIFIRCLGTYSTCTIGCQRQIRAETAAQQWHQ